MTDPGKRDLPSANRISMVPLKLSELAEGLKRQAGFLGFAEARITAAVEPGRYSDFLTWLDHGYAGEMSYLESRKDAYRHPASVMAGVRTILVLALPYSPKPTNQSPLATGVGRIARYACGSVDYHDWIHDRLKQLGHWLEQHYARTNESLSESLAFRGIVDTAPLLEREFAQLSGMGWIGKNTLLLNRTLGSYFFLACLLTNIDLPCDSSHVQDHCGSCRACIEACPTQAFVEPHVLDASRCISYLTIEQRGMPPIELRSGIGDWLYGCDICQEVCPWNRRAPSLMEEAFQPSTSFTELPLREILSMDQEHFRVHFRRTPFWRAKRRGVLRNAAIVAGNQRSPDCIEPLKRLLQDEDELIRAAAVWSLSQMELQNIEEIFEPLSLKEQSSLVQAELQYFRQTRTRAL
ncbi:MAG: tRNA epoxyqueuosine(34) reductase QueG [Planctomycetaceae bacterium]|nr:tRNA epoxyqueuosine(34) reductase QueG [Planctomycetaceae bacterium]